MKLIGVSLKRINKKLIQKNNEKENKNRQAHEYKVKDEILCEGKQKLKKFGPKLWEGPFKITKVNNNGTICIIKGYVTETINIRRNKPYHNAN